MEKLTPRAVIFDLGSTLIEYPSSIWEQVSAECVTSMRQYLVKHGHAEPSEEEFQEHYRVIRDEYRKTAAETLVEWTVPQAVRLLIARYGVDGDDSLVDRLFAAYYEPFETYLYAYDDAQETLEKIRSRYGVIGLVSNTIFPEEAHRGELERFGLASYLDFMIFSSTFGFRKPHPGIFYKAANLAGYAPSECVYIGDRYVEDIQGPQAVGMPAILRYYDQREYPEDMPVDIRRVDRLAQLDRHFDF